MNPVKYRSALIAAAMLAGTSLAAAVQASGPGSGPTPGPNSGPTSGQPQRTGTAVDDANDLRLKSAPE